MLWLLPKVPWVEAMGGLGKTTGVVFPNSGIRLLGLPYETLAADRIDFLILAVPKVLPLEPHGATLKRWQMNAGVAGGSAWSGRLDLWSHGDRGEHIERAHANQAKS